MSLGKKLLNARKSKGYSQVELSKKSGLTQTLISEYENDKTIPNAKSLFFIAKSLDISMDELFGLKPESINIKNTKILRRMKAIEKMSAMNQEQALKSIDIIIKGLSKQ